LRRLEFRVELNAARAAQCATLIAPYGLDVYEAFFNAESKGASFNALIRDRYPYREL
jgi:hypothetical protein